MRKRTRLAKDRMAQKLAMYHFRAGMKHLYIAANLAPKRFHYKRALVLGVVNNAFERTKNNFERGNDLWWWSGASIEQIKLVIRRRNVAWLGVINENYKKVKDELKIR